MVTGDKGTTAQSIGYSCGILSTERKLTKVEIDKESDDQRKRDALSQLVDESDEMKDVMISGTALQQIIETVESET